MSVDASEIGKELFIDAGFDGLKVVNVITVEVDETSEYDLWGKYLRND